MKESLYFHGPNLISWISGKQSLTTRSSCEAELVGMVAGVHHGIKPTTQSWGIDSTRTKSKSVE
eukprot:12923910-Prorocentrum_lima.AAC.1